jgi:hypothetical protein
VNAQLEVVRIPRFSHFEMPAAESYLDHMQNRRARIDSLLESAE